MFLAESSVVSPGLVVDTTVTVLLEHGFDLSKPDLCTRIVSREEEIEIEANVTSRAAVIVNGLVGYESYFDRYQSDYTTLSGTVYDTQRGRVQRQDFSVTAVTQRTREGHLTATLLPTALGIDESEMSTIEGIID